MSALLMDRLNLAVATKPRAKSAKPVPACTAATAVKILNPRALADEIALVSRGGDIAASSKVLSSIADAIEILVALWDEPNNYVTPAERAVGDLSIMLSNRMLSPVFDFLEIELITNKRADAAEAMLQDPVSVLETFAAITVGSPYADAVKRAFELVDGALDDLRDASLWSANDKASPGSWRKRSVQARDDIVELLRAARAIEEDRGVDNADSLYLIGMAADLLEGFGLGEASDLRQFTVAAHRSAALIKGAKHVPGPRPTATAATLMDQALARLDSLTDELMSGASA